MRLCVNAARGHLVPLGKLIHVWADLRWLQCGYDLFAIAATRGAKTCLFWPPLQAVTCLCHEIFTLPLADNLGEALIGSLKNAGVRDSGKTIEM
jgi:hypothetical protein